MYLKNIENMDSKEFRSLLASGIKTTLKFWHDNLEQICPHSRRIDPSQIHYVGHFLTKSCIVSMTSEIYFPTFSSLIKIYRHSLYDILSKQTPALSEAAKVMENAGCQILLFSGFYSEYAQRHYSLNDLREMGSDFFAKSAVGVRKEVLKKNEC